MMNYSQLKNQALSTLTELFPNVGFELEAVPYQGTISAFFIRLNTEEDLSEKWEKISNAIAIYFQTKLETEFERWNLYLFYLLPIKVERALKYKIENDPISSRKIIIEMFNNTSLSDIVSNHITNTNLNTSRTIDENQVIATAFSKNQILAEAINKFSSIKKKKSGDEDIVNILNEIEKRLKNEI